MRTTHINLLPWREERRKQRQVEFIVLLVVAAAAAVLVWMFWQSSVQSAITDQNARNRHIEKEISELDQRISEIQELEQRRSELVERMRVIQELQGNRPTIVYVFDELVRKLPDGVYFTEVRRVGALYTITGVAESNNRISRLMRNLGDSPWFTDPTLISVAAVEANSQANRFTLTARQGSPRSETEGEK
ncbi:PilN domain-containing protein [Alcanivorax sp. JB21]|uniref:PilN domain-containing protein n=1 Tax=Alcanivorax limicola TaxID=2874102 RepID=UPI001CC17AE1|nr:PilN domain-containing protein [Alcanivorax limicola]MBZ2189296.1 PilN domain-containing protein [Alcanivorax limicola]